MNSPIFCQKLLTAATTAIVVSESVTATEE